MMSERIIKIHHRLYGHGCGIIIEIDGNSYSLDGYDHSKIIAYQFNCFYFDSHNRVFNDKNIEK